MTDHRKIARSNPEIARIIRGELRRIGLTPRLFLKDRSGIPDGLTARSLNRVIAHARTAISEEHAAWILTALAKLPSLEETAVVGGYLPKSGRSARVGVVAWIDLTDAMKAELAREQARTGLGPHALMSRLNDAPPGLTANTIVGWSKTVKTIDPTLWDFVLASIKALPDRAAPPPPSRRASGQWNRPDHERLETARVEELKRERARTGIGVGKLFRVASDRPADLSEGIVTGWLVGRTRTAKPEHVAYILALYRSLTDRR